jgi:hypothetical protein
MAYEEIAVPHRLLLPVGDTGTFQWVTVVRRIEVECATAADLIAAGLTLPATEEN